MTPMLTAGSRNQRRNGEDRAGAYPVVVPIPLLWDFHLSEPEYDLENF